MIDIILVCAVIVLAFVLFATEKLRVDFVAILILATLTVIGQFRDGFLTVDEAFSGFSDPATLTIAAMFILSSGLAHTGAIAALSGKVAAIAGDSEIKLFMVLVIIKLLMPLSFASIVGGTATLIGTSTNILVSSLANRRGIEPFSMFELTKLGAIFLVIGLVYLAVVGRRLLPDRSPTSLTRKYELARYLTGLVVPEDSPLVGKSAAEARLNELYDVTILEIIRGDSHIRSGLRDAKLEAGDHLMARGAFDGIMEMKRSEGVAIRSEIKYADQELTTEDTVLLEAVVSTSATLCCCKGGAARSSISRTNPIRWFSNSSIFLRCEPVRRSTQSVLSPSSSDSRPPAWLRFSSPLLSAAFSWSLPSASACRRPTTRSTGL
jgi:hypothetical protein